MMNEKGTEKTTPYVYRECGRLHLRGEHTPEQMEAAEAVDYHNYFKVNPWTATEWVQKRCPPGWRAWVQFFRAEEVPEGAVQVGQVKVRSGDPMFPLYIYPVEEATGEH